MIYGTFNINAIVFNGNFKEISVLMRSWLWKNSLNNFLLEISLVVLLLLVSSIASFFDRFLGIRGHPSFMNQSNILKTFIVTFGVFNDASIFLSSPFSSVLFDFLISVDF
jgi:hypothetical protein